MILVLWRNGIRDTLKTYWRLTLRVSSSLTRTTKFNVFSNGIITNNGALAQRQEAILSKGIQE